MKISIIGLGWYAKALSEQLVTSHTVSGTKSTREGVANWDIEAVSAQYLNLNQKVDYTKLKSVFDVDVLVINIPPSAAEQTPYVDQMKKISIGIKSYPVKHLVFISSTGVFGDHQLKVDEDTTPEPTRGNGEVLLRAERFFASHFAGRLSIIRPGGLVGGDRHPAKYLSGRANVSGKDHPVNLVHRKDLVALTEFLIENKVERSCFHAVATEHPSKKEYYEAAAEKLGLKKPEFDDSDSSVGKLIRGEKTQNDAIKFELNNPFDF